MTIGIMGAMTEEIDHLVEGLSDCEVFEVGKRVYHRGTLWGFPVVLVFARWGKVAAATTATTLITKFGVDEIIFTGVAGATSPDLKTGDVVIGRSVFQHDMDARPFFPQHEIPLLGVSSFTVSPSKISELRQATEEFFESDGPAVKSRAAERGIKLHVPKVVEGNIASGDKFFAEKASIDELLTRLPSISCVEMEGGAVAQVCHEYNIPFSIIRTISDTGDEGAPVDFPAFVSSVASS